MGTTSTVNVAAGFSFKLLGADLTAGFTKLADERRIFLHQDITAPNEGVTIAQLISDINSLGGSNLDEAQIEQQLKVVAKPPLNLADLRVVLRVAYFDIRTPKGGKTTYEYAIRVDVEAKGLIPEDIELINVERISLAVWNTTNEKVKKQLAISTD